VCSRAKLKLLGKVVRQECCLPIPFYVFVKVSHKHISSYLGAVWFGPHMIHYVCLSDLVYRRIFCSWSMHLSTFNCHSVIHSFLFSPFSFLLTRLPTYYLNMPSPCPQLPTFNRLLLQRCGFPTQPGTHPYSKWLLLLLRDNPYQRKGCVWAL